MSKREESLCLIYSSSILSYDIISIKTPIGVAPIMKRKDVALIGLVRSECQRFPITVREAGKLISDQFRTGAETIETNLRIEGLNVKMGPVQELIVSDGVLMRVTDLNLGGGIASTIVESYQEFQKRFTSDCEVKHKRQEQDPLLVGQGDNVAQKLDIASKAGVSPELMIKASSGDPAAQNRVNELINAYQARIAK